MQYNKKYYAHKSEYLCNIIRGYCAHKLEYLCLDEVV